MAITVPALVGRVDRLETELREHRADDQGQFAQLRTDIANMEENLVHRIDRMGEDLQGQITTLTLDKAKAEGRAEGIASVKAAISAPRWWHPVAIGCAVVALTTALGLTGWLAKTVYSQQQSEIDALKNRPISTVTVNPAQDVQPPTVPASPPSAPTNE